MATVSVSLGLALSVLCGEVEELKNFVARVRKSEPGAIQRKGIKWLLFKNQSSHTTEMVGDSSEMSYIVHEDNKRKKVRVRHSLWQKDGAAGKKQNKNNKNPRNSSQAHPEPISVSSSKLLKLSIRERRGWT